MDVEFPHVPQSGKASISLYIVDCDKLHLCNKYADKKTLKWYTWKNFLISLMEF